MKSYNYLNLQQKLCRIRKKIPALVRKRYSEEVDYDFTKIDDVYRFLTPALNKYGVNFEVYAENPTKIDAQGHLIYLYQENGFWMYEADLTVGWVNADNPTEQEKTVIHVVGTHEMAEKAKGTAWTYGLKYYLFSKFNINQDGDDADFHDFRKEPKTQEKDQMQDGKKTSAPKTEKKPDRVAQVPKEQKESRTLQKEIADSVKKQVIGSSPEKKEAIKAETPEKSVKHEGKPLEKEHKEEKAVKTEQGRSVQTKSKVQVKKDTSSSNGQMEKDKISVQAEESAAKETEDMPEGQMSFTDNMLGGSGNADNKENDYEEIDNKETQEEDFHPVSNEEIPFEDVDENQDDDFFQSLMDDMEEESFQDGEMTIERARKVICIAGAFTNRPLGDVLDAGERGRKTLEWLANRFMGPEKEPKEAAAVLLEELNRRRDEQQAA